ncbi:MAG: CehA/McbA family metallohydrolase [Armatimonadota bacterium]|nr:MAG: CehA/McbA family metallohydrolase [Armatimonadota bacterium]
MEFADPFAAPGHWYKGNLHTHTTQSDGVLEPKEVVSRYRAAGYDFLALTDHHTVTRVAGASDDAFLLLLGTELDGDRGQVAESVHVVAFGLSGPAEVPLAPSVPAAIAWAREHGGEALIAHPYWSGLTVSDMLRWDGHLGVEIFNTGCHYEIAKGCSTVHWDDLLGQGRRLWGFAVDDSHHYRSENHPTDTARAWVMVKAVELTREAILSSLRDGLFYSSWGPTIHEVTLTGEQVTARTSPVKEINFIAQRWASQSFSAPEGSTLKQASFRPSGREEYLRVECRDPEGRWAYSNPIFFGERKPPS